jgi:protease I
MDKVSQDFSSGRNDLHLGTRRMFFIMSKRVMSSMLIGALALLQVFCCASGNQKPQSLEGKKIVMLIASGGFRDEELREPKEILEAAGAQVLVASSKLEESQGMLGMKAHPELLLDSLRVADYDAVIFVGGVGAQEYWADSTAHAIAKAALDSGKVLGAICIAPVTLANAGVLSGKKATVWSSERERLEAAGAVYTGADVEVDGRLITASGPGAAEEFGKRVAELLSE